MAESLPVAQKCGGRTATVGAAYHARGYGNPAVGAHAVTSSNLVRSTLDRPPGSTVSTPACR